MKSCRYYELIQFIFFKRMYGQKPALDPWIRALRHKKTIFPILHNREGTGIEITCPEQPVLSIPFPTVTLSKNAYIQTH
jgi:hypothetical protein